MATNMSKNVSELIRRSIWARSLSEADLARVEANIVERHIPGGSYICHKGDSVDYWYGIVEGLAKISNTSEDGRGTSYQGIRAGGWFGEGSLLRNEPRLYDVIALRDTTVGCLPRSTFNWLYANSLPFSHALIELLNERLSHVMGILEQERLLDPSARVARSLSAFFNPVIYAETDYRIRINQTELGQLAGISRQRANRALRELEEVGILRSAYGVVTVLDVKRLGEFETGALKNPKTTSAEH